MKAHRALAAVAVLCALLAAAALVAAKRRAISVNADDGDALQPVGWMAGDWETATQQPTSKSIGLGPPAARCSATAGPSDTAK